MTNALRTVAFAAALLTLTGCGGQRRSAEEAMRQNLKDPDSARFGEFYYNSKTKRACLTTNAKNSMGGYTGDKQAELQRTKEGWDLNGNPEITFADCKSEYADVVQP